MNLPSAVIVRISGDGGQFFDVPAEDVRPIHNFEFTEVVFRLPNNSAARHPDRDDQGAYADQQCRYDQNRE